MRSIDRPAWPRVAVLALAVGWAGESVGAQEVGPGPSGVYGAYPATPSSASGLIGPYAGPSYPAPTANAPSTPARSPRRRWFRPRTWDPAGVRLVQATPGDVSAPGGATLEGELPESPGAITESPSPSTADLRLPAAEREFGGGEPTETAAETEAAEEEEEEEKPTFLIRALGLEDSPVKVYGWIQNSFTGNPSQPSDHVNFGVNPNYKANQWMGNQYYLILENPLEQNDKINFGFRIDNLFGNDWQFNKMYGLYDNAFIPGRFTGYDTAQMYGEVHLPFLTRGGIDVKGGRFYTLAGYEVVPAIGRPLLSVPYMFNYGQPFTHFGVLSTWHVTDQLNIYNSAINGWDRWVNANYKWGYMGGYSWTSKSGKLNLTQILVWGPNQFPRYLPANTQIVPTGATSTPFLAGRRNLGYGANDRTLFTTVLSYTWNDKLTQVMETDQAIEKNVPGTGPGGTNQDAEWYSFGNWFLYDFFGNGKLTGVWRSEIFRDNNGVRTGFATNFSEMTLGLIAKPMDWLWIRPEARYDWARSGRPYNGGNSNSQFTLGFDVIVLF